GPSEIGRDTSIPITFELGLEQWAFTETLPLTSREVLGGMPVFPGSRTGGQALGSTSTRLLSRHAPARGIPMLWGRTCPAFARWMVASPAAQPSRLRTFPEILGKRGKEGPQIQMRRQPG